LETVRGRRNQGRRVLILEEAIFARVGGGGGAWAGGIERGEAWVGQVPAVALEQARRTSRRVLIMRVGVSLDTVLVRYVVEPERFSDRQLSSSVRSTDLFHGLSAVSASPAVRCQGESSRLCPFRAVTLPGGTSYPLEPGFLIVGVATSRTSRTSRRVWIALIPSIV
jgi:hypothetical protein